MDLGLSGKVALVTGSYRGTGSGVARVLAAEGA
ncbi:MAG: beta-ketoacyl-ACP reductase, partial [Acidimicrobiia bacterium]|nr:beta-ketoacyl-ACP reductase [Acidimicrobiia bacterium]